MDAFSSNELVGRCFLSSEEVRHAMQDKTEAPIVMCLGKR